MFGEDGWCHSCGIQNRPQCGSLELQARGFGTVVGAWVPNWLFDVYCLERSLAERIVAAGFEVRLLPIAWHGESPGDAVQIVVPTSGDTWFDPDELRATLLAEHPSAGAMCDDCGTWRWMPLGFEPIPPMYTLGLPALRITPPLGDVDIAASPEWFGDGMKSFRKILFRRELAEMLAAASPRDFKVGEVKIVSGGI